MLQNLKAKNERKEEMKESKRRNEEIDKNMYEREKGSKGE
jgi:hypothetical protein